MPLGYVRQPSISVASSQGTRHPPQLEDGRIDVAAGTTNEEGLRPFQSFEVAKIYVAAVPQAQASSWKLLGVWQEFSLAPPVRRRLYRYELIRKKAHMSVQLDRRRYVPGKPAGEMIVQTVSQTERAAVVDENVAKK